jgi:hypothetical protein
MSEVPLYSGDLNKGVKVRTKGGQSADHKGNGARKGDHLKRNDPPRPETVNPTV